MISEQVRGKNKPMPPKEGPLWRAFLEWFSTADLGPWEQRMYGWGKAQFWQSTWGPKPGESGCRVPANLIGG